MTDINTEADISNDNSSVFALDDNAFNELFNKVVSEEDVVEDSEVLSNEEVEDESTTTIDDTTTDDVEESDTITEPYTDEVTKIKSEYDKIFAPFKANGVDIKVDSAEEAIRLMQMGAGYHKSMQDLKPVKRIQKMLEKADLLDEEKLDFLINVAKGNKDSIRQLLSKNNLNPLDLDMDETNNAPLPSYKVADSQVALEETINLVKATPTGARTLDVVSTQWDLASREELVKNPEYINHINEHMRLGIYDRISSVLAKQKLLGTVTGSDLEAYTKIGDMLHAQGAFNDLVAPVATAQPRQAPTKSVTSVEDPIAKKKAAAGLPNTKAKSTKPTEVDVWKMDSKQFDEYFKQLK